MTADAGNQVTTSDTTMAPSVAELRTRGRVRGRLPLRLDSVEPGTTFRVDRVDDQIGAALRYLTDLGVRPGIIVEVLEQAPFGGPLWLRIDGREQALGDLLTTVIYGDPAPAPAMPTPTPTPTEGLPR